MNNILQFIYKYQHWIVFIVLEIVCFVLLFSYNSFQSSVYLSTANEVIARLLNGKNKVTSYFDLVEQNQALASQNAELLQRVVGLEMLNAQYQQDSLTEVETINRIRHAGYHITSALVIDKSVNNTDNYFTLNRGEADGIRPDMGVVSVDGVVGVVFRCTEHYSLVMPLLNSNSSISCKVNKEIGYLRWDGGDARYATLHDLPFYSVVEPGDTIVTSGSSSFFPEDVMVGRVEEVYPSPDGQYMRLKVLLSAQFASLKHAFVVSKMDAEELAVLYEMLKPKKNKK